MGDAGGSGGRTPEVPVHTVRFNFLSTRTFATMSPHPETAMHYGDGRIDGEYRGTLWWMACDVP
jgi:hypothetical protein